MKIGIKTSSFLWVLVIVLVPMGFGEADAQTFKTVYSFTGGSDGGSPQTPLLLSGNSLFGTTSSGGTGNAGTLFRINTDGSGFAVIHAFTTPHKSGIFLTNSDGGGPLGGLLISSNTLYGTTSGAGPWGNGTVFAVNIDGTEFRTLHAFGGVTDSGHPFGELVLSGNMLYGASQEGISPDGLGSDNGSVFAISTDGSGFTTLYSFFNGGADGWAPYSGLVQSGNTVYGSVALGGSSQHGNLYALNEDGTSFTVLYSFSGPDGDFPLGDLLLVGNTLYGVTEEGGTDGTPGGGTIFSINTDATAFRTIYSFSSLSSAPNAPNSSGAAPHGGLLLLNDTLYGTASFGGASGNGTVFKLNVDGTGFTVLHNFTATSGSPGRNNDGAHPGSSMIFVNNILYGATANGGSSGSGTIFSITLPGTPPLLTINRSVENVVLTWPTNASGFQLESATDLFANTVWQTVTNPIVIMGDQNTVTTEISSKPKFFRLTKQ